MTLPRERVQELLALIGLSADDFARIRAEADEGRARALLEDLQARAKRGYKRAALDLHPDRTGGDADKAATFAELGPLVAEIEALRVVRRPRHQIFIQTVQVWGSGGGTASTTNTVSGSWGGVTWNVSG